MKYIDKHLMEGEQVVYIPQLHSSLYWGALSWAVFGIVIMVFPTDGTLFKIQLSASLILILISVLKCIKMYGGRQYVLTNRRIIAKKGLVQRDSLELLLRKCEGVQIRQSVLGRIFDYGTVIVTTGEATNNFEYIKNPIAFSSAINQMIDSLKSFE